MRLTPLSRLIAPALAVPMILSGCLPAAPALDQRPSITAPLTGLAPFAGPVPSAAAPPIASVDARSALGRMPLSFVENQGQLDPRVEYYVQGQATSLYFTDHGLTLALSDRAERSTSTQKGQVVAPTAGIDAADAAAGSDATRQSSVVELEFVGAQPDARPAGRDQQQRVVNSFVEAPERWRTGLPTYGGLTYQNLWPGIDLAYRGTGGRLKYEFVVQPGADPSQIRLAYHGASDLRIDPSGDLVISTPAGDLRDAAPYAYQEVDGQRQEVSMAYRLDGGTSDSRGYGFDLGAYDRSQPLIMDPALIYSGFLGGSDVEGAEAIAVNQTGEAFVVGVTSSTNFPVVGGSPDVPKSDAFLSKISADGSTLLYSTYLGGSEGDHAYGVAVDSTGRPVIVGMTMSPNFPTTANAWDKVCGVKANGTCDGGASDVFVTRLDLDGTIQYSTFLGGEGPDIGSAIAVGPGDAVFVTGVTSSQQFPHKSPIANLPGFQTQLKGSQDAFVAKLDPSKAGQSSLVYATFLGGDGDDSGEGIAVDGQGNAWVTGLAGGASINFPVKNPIQPDQPGADAFVSKLNATGTQLLFSTYLGGNDSVEFARAIAVDVNGDAYVTGHTSSINFPITPGAYDMTCSCVNGGPLSVFVTKITSQGKLAYSTYLGGNKKYQHARAIAVDTLGDAYVLGVTGSADFPVTPGALDIRCGTDSIGTCDEVGGSFAEDNFLSVLNPTGSKLMYSQFIGGHGAENAGGGGVAVTSPGVIYVAASTPSNDFKTTSSWDQTYNDGSMDAYAEKIVIGADLSITKTASPNPVKVGNEILYTITVQNAGLSKATGVTVDDQIGTKSQYVLGAISTTQGACVAQQQNHIVCNLGVMDKASPVTILVHLTPTVLAGGPNTPDFIKNTATVTANEPDPTPANNTAKVTVNINP